MIAMEEGCFGPDTKVDDKEFKDLVSLFMAETKRLSEYDHAKAAFEAFILWIEPKHENVEPRSVVLNVTLTKHWGGVSVTYGFQGTFTVTDNKSIRRAYAQCESEVNTQFAFFEQMGLHRMNAPTMPGGSQSDGAGQSSSGAETTVFLGDVIVTEQKDDKMYYKVVGAQYGKYGVRVWPETLKQAGIDIPDRVGKVALGRECRVLLHDGKPRKVINIS